MSVLNMTNEAILTSIKRMADAIDRTSVVNIKEYDPNKTAIVVVDMINGFAKEGALSSPRVEALISPLEGLLKDSSGVKKVFLCDRHPIDTAEFDSYLPHAIEGTSEALIVEELYALSDENSSVIFKNSTNGMMSKAMQHYVSAHESDIENWIVVGDCTDICILQFALSLKTYFNEINLKRRVIVPVNLVDTFELAVTNHYAELLNTFALFNLQQNGVEIVQMA